MFRCQNCDTVVPAGTRSSKIIVETRAKEYAPRGADPSERRRRFPRGRGPRKKQKYDRGGTGREIVREKMVCPKCAESMSAEIAAAAAEAAAVEAAAAEAAAAEAAATEAAAAEAAASTVAEDETVAAAE